MKKKIKVAVQLAVLVTAIGVVAFQGNRAYAAMEDYMTFVEEVDAAELAKYEAHLNIETEETSESEEVETETNSVEETTEEELSSEDMTEEESTTEEVETTEEITSEDYEEDEQVISSQNEEFAGEMEEVASENNNTQATSKKAEKETTATQTTTKETAAPTTVAPTTVAPTTAAPTEAPTTAAPTPAPTEAPTTVAPTPAPAPAISIDSVGGFNQEIKNAFKALGFNVTVTAGVPYAGVFSPTRRIIDLNSNAANQASLLHEIGHFVSFLKIGAAESAEFVEIYNAEKGAYTGGNAAYVTSKSGEYFAESFRDFVENPAGLQASRPRTYEYVARIANSINANDVAIVRATYGI